MFVPRPISFVSTCATVLVAIALGAVPARAESASDLVARNLAARGGDKLAAISTVEFTGKALAGGSFELTYREIRARKHGAARFEESIQGLTLVQGYDGTVGWRINPFEGRRDAERMSHDDAQALADGASIDGQLLAAKTRGSTVTYLGQEEFEGTDAYKLRVVDPSGVQYMYFLDPDTFLEIKVVETRKLRGAPQITETEYSDYELVNGAYFPFAIQSGPPGADAGGQQQITIESAHANVPVNDAMFAMPAAPGAK